MRLYLSLPLPCYWQTAISSSNFCIMAISWRLVTPARAFTFHESSRSQTVPQTKSDVTCFCICLWFCPCVCLCLGRCICLCRCPLPFACAFSLCIRLSLCLAPKGLVGRSKGKMLGCRRIGDGSPISKISVQFRSNFLGLNSPISGFLIRPPLPAQCCPRWGWQATTTLEVPRC